MRQCHFYPGQAGVGARRLPPADGAVQGAAGPRREDCLPAEAAAGGRGAHQGRNISSLHSKMRRWRGTVNG